MKPGPVTAASLLLITAQSQRKHLHTHEPLPSYKEAQEKMNMKLEEEFEQKFLRVKERIMGENFKKQLEISAKEGYTYENIQHFYFFTQPEVHPHLQYHREYLEFSYLATRLKDDKELREYFGPEIRFNAVKNKEITNERTKRHDFYLQIDWTPEVKAENKLTGKKRETPEAQEHRQTRSTSKKLHNS